MQWAGACSWWQQLLRLLFCLMLPGVSIGAGATGPGRQQLLAQQLVDPSSSARQSAMLQQQSPA
jgi:hypothetical protein